MNKCIAFVDDDERFLEQSREHLTYRGYEFIGWRDSRMAFDAIMRQKEHLAELPTLAVREIAALQDHLVQTVGIVIAVTDTGCGIAADCRERVFESEMKAERRLMASC